MKGTGIAAAVVGGIAIGVSLIAVAHEDHNRDSRLKATAFTAITPILNVRSVEASIEHYTSVLGFKKDWDWPAENEDKTFASISNGEVNIFLAENAQGARPVWIYYGVGDVDELHEAYTAAGADIKQKPVDQPWGAREMLVVDKDGHILRIGGSSKKEHAEGKEGDGDGRKEHSEGEEEHGEGKSARGESEEGHH